MDDKSYPKLWTITRTITLILLVWSLLLAAKSLAGGGEGEIHAYMAGDNPVIIVRNQPFANGGLSMMIDRGQPVTLIEPEGGLPEGWIFIQSEDGSGWVRDHEISLSPPE